MEDRAEVGAAVSSFVADSFGVMVSLLEGFDSIGGVALSSAMVRVMGRGGDGLILMVSWWMADGWWVDARDYMVKKVIFFVGKKIERKLY